MISYISRGKKSSDCENSVIKRDSTAQDIVTEMIKTSQDNLLDAELRKVGKEGLISTFPPCIWLLRGFSRALYPYSLFRGLGIVVFSNQDFSAKGVVKGVCVGLG